MPSDPVDTDRLDHEPREVAGYRLLRRIGEGSMSVVYLSYDVTAGVSVAVKLLADHLAHSREFVNRFYREARLCRLLSHPNLVRGQAAGFDTATGKHYLVLELIEGPSAQAALVAHGPLPVGTVVRVGIDIASALEFLHSRGYVHRDVKPDNVLLQPGGAAKLADLGLTKRLNDDPHLTSIAQGVGTTYYMAYEQALNPNLVDGRSDIFALGATLYHLLTGEVPFAGATHEDVIREKERNAFRPLRVVNTAVPVELAEVVSAMLARDPRARVQTAAQVIERLEATGLATAIPRLVADDLDSGPGSDAPTRADLKPFERTESDREPPPAPAGSCLVSGAGAILAPQPPISPAPPRPVGLFAWLAGAGFAAGALVTALASKPAAPTRPATNPGAPCLPATDGTPPRGVRILPEPHEPQGSPSPGRPQ